MPKRSAGILMYRRQPHLEVLLVHPGGPFWAKKDLGAWSIPKGEYVEGEEPLAAARRELEEETGKHVEGDVVSLGDIVQPGRKVVTAFALEGDFDPRELRSNVFELEWPPRSGRKKSFPEVDRAGWFSPDEALRRILSGQRELITRLLAALGETRRGGFQTHPHEAALIARVPAECVRAICPNARERGSRGNMYRPCLSPWVPDLPPGQARGRPGHEIFAPRHICTARAVVGPTPVPAASATSQRGGAPWSSACRERAARRCVRLQQHARLGARQWEASAGNASARAADAAR